jgi:enterochelin esterase-like enzyme
MIRCTVFGLLILPALALAQTPLPPAPKGFDASREGVAHGTVATVEYDSKTVGGKRPMTIYLPPGFSKDAKYPVFYLLHGATDDHNTWMKKGSAAAVLDNMYADKRIVPMIVVMPNSYTDPKKEGAKTGGVSKFQDDLIKDVIPFVEANYPVLADREQRAIVGWSMGGGQAIMIGLSHLDKFAWIGGLSSALGKGAGLTKIDDPDIYNKRLRMLWLSCGDKDNLLKVNEAFHTSLAASKVNHIWHLDSGTHEWAVPRNDLYLIGAMLFREKK